MVDQMNEQAKTSAPVWYWVIAVVALLWNLMGCMGLATELFAQEAVMESQGWTEPQKEWARSTPNWIYFVYAVAVGGGVAGSIALLMRSPLSLALFAVSLVAIIIQMVYAMLIAGGLQIMGPSAAVMPCLVILLGAVLLCFSWFAKGRGWFGVVVSETAGAEAR